MQRTIISDASCIILLNKIDEIELLNKLFGTIFTTQEVAEEYGKPLPDWILIKKPKNLEYQQLISATLDKGEASAIALALEFDNPLLIIDDLKGRRFAEKIELKITGTLGVIIDAKQSGIISSVKLLLEKIKKTNFRITEDLVKEVLKQSGE